MKSVIYKLRGNPMSCSSADVKKNVSPSLIVYDVFVKIQEETWDPIWIQCRNNVWNKVKQEIGK